MIVVPVLAQGVATKEDIDKTMKLGMAHPMGPLVSFRIPRAAERFGWR